jgi:uncharacterized protein GlcG (DUF336 family)
MSEASATGRGATTRTLTYQDARDAVDAAIAKATEIGSPSSIAVLDHGRELLAFARMDGALLASPEISQAKAYTARCMNMSTGDLGQYTQPGGPFYGLENIHRRSMVSFGGGLPLTLGGEIVGAIGVAGGSADQDTEVATAGAQALEG